MANTPLRRQVLSGYLRLLRASHQAFSNDTFALNASVKELRRHFEENRSETSSRKIQKMIKAIDETEDFLLNNIVQGKLIENGNYAVKLKEPQISKLQDKGELTHIDAHQSGKPVVTRSCVRKDGKSTTEPPLN